MLFYRIPQRIRSKINNQVHKKGKISAEINYFLSTHRICGTGFFYKSRDMVTFKAYLHLTRWYWILAFET
jgi:hypothetical protein